MMNFFTTCVMFLPLSALALLDGNGGGKQIQTLTTQIPLRRHTGSETSLTDCKVTFRGGDKGVGILGSLQSMAKSYSDAMKKRPTVTKACTGLVLCSLGDIMAQVQSFQEKKSTVSSSSSSSTQQPFTMDYTRLARFAFRGVISTLIWGVWYDISNDLSKDENMKRMLVGVGMHDKIGKRGNSDDRDAATAEAAFINSLRIFMLMMAEQFVMCPIVYSTWDLPVSTLLNGAPISKIPFEIKSKLIPMLIDNFKVWTPANILIYSSPVEYRTLLANIVGIIWQAIMSGFAADCGK